MECAEIRSQKYIAASKCSENVLPHACGTKLTRGLRQYIYMYFQYRHTGIPCAWRFFPLLVFDSFGGKDNNFTVISYCFIA